MNIGNQLYELRKKANLSQEEVASRLNVTRQTISKWETNQSMPDLDKIVPLCELYGISADSLLKGVPEKQEKLELPKEPQIKERARVISISVFLYFLSIIWIILSEELDTVNEGIQVSVFLLICAGATVYLIYHLMCFPKTEQLKMKEVSKYKAIDEIMALLFTVIYLGVSFYTNAWGITWLIWIVYAFVIQILHLIFEWKGDSFDK